MYIVLLQLLEMKNTTEEKCFLILLIISIMVT